MAKASRKVLLPALLSLAAFALPSPATADAAPSGAVAPLVGNQCLATSYPSFYAASVKSCNGSSSEQRWTVSGELIRMVAHPGMCLSTNYPSFYAVSVDGCNGSSAKQRWTFDGELIRMAAHPGMCLSTNYPSFLAASVSGCNASSSQQRWTRMGELISLTAY
ncbi:RICIN domain-containing protein [Streptomyces katsurahamanus]|uniref:Ricin-type beta-trefoil lectin domain protein n=1 Tax=Streptomyces katsurahamanus TaxID=2577098 RepID=A0ABW9NPR2_9ACTN|nr:RICIN domain-containing protein [Streptomyces katsurahamanus]MQS35245.1 ricin-type beta-trefoil lectin domain protein [Streptomyces katsurahamanus]